MADTSDERALATWLAAQDDATLEGLFLFRGVSPSAPWRGFFDAAEALLDAASIDRALVRLPRAHLAALAWGGAAPLTALALARPDGAPYAAVDARVAVARAADPAAFVAAAVSPAPDPSTDAASAAAAEHALTAVAGLADLAIAALDGHVTTTGSGSVSATDRRRLLEDGIAASGDELDDLLAGGADAGLLRLVDREWRVTPEGDAWLPQPTLDRWQTVAEAFRAGLPDGIRSGDGGIVPPGDWPDAYPLDPEWPPRAAALHRRAIRWGLLAPDGTEPEWGRALRAGAAPAPERIGALLPPEIDRIYLQADLSAIAPGPLRSHLDLRLRTMAARESRAQASTYRFSAQSLAAAIAAGESAASVREFLSTISLTGIPQPLEYLLDRAAESRGVAAVSEDPATGRTRIDTDDPHLRETLAVDRELRAIGLIDDGDALVTRVGRDTVYWTLVDSRYPAVALDAEGRPEPLRRRRVSSATVPDVSPYSPLVQTLRGAAESDSDAAWLERELQQAVRGRSIVTVDVRLPDGSVRTFTLEATGFGGGRVRGRDRGADVERTLPLSSIVSVRPAS